MYHRKGLSAFAITAADRAIASRCMAKLQSYGIGLEQAVDHYIETVARFRQSPTIAQIIEKMVE